jgi:DNA-binding HxlR family transcriptional regulator
MAWRDYGYVVTSKYRTKVIESLSVHPKTPKQISSEEDISISHVSRALRELVQRDLVSCINPNDVKGRVYALTDKGKALTKIFEKNQTKGQFPKNKKNLKN